MLHSRKRDQSAAYWRQQATGRSREVAYLVDKMKERVQEIERAGEGESAIQVPRNDEGLGKSVIEALKEEGQGVALGWRHHEPCGCGKEEPCTLYIFPAPVWGLNGF